MDSGETMSQLETDLGAIDFHHPFAPYDVQLEFMKTVYKVLEAGNGQVGILESPTGTGKSLSLICATLTWLRHHKSSRFDETVRLTTQSLKDEPDWLVEQLLQRKREDLVKAWEERETRLEAVRTKDKARQERAATQKKRRVQTSDGSTRRGKDDDEDAEWLLADADERDVSSEQDPLSGLSKESRDVLTKIGLGRVKHRDEDEGDILEEPVKIYYTSRTHSQLSQFITEIRRPSFPYSIPDTVASRDNQTTESVKLLPLSSRQRLCINPAVAKLHSTQAINDRCAELQQPKSTKKCAFVPKEELLAQTHQFRDTALATIPDIEDLHQVGESLGVCPYYASRTAIPGAEIITLPYPLLLQKSAREALGIKLEGNVVVIDEAHNIMDAVANVHAAEIRQDDLKRARGMLGVYVKRFGKKLKGVNRVNVGRVGRTIDGLLEWMNGAAQLKAEQGIVDANDLTRSKGIDQINMFELIQYIQESKLAFKIEGYAAHVESEKDPKGTPRSPEPVLHKLVSFLVALTNLSSEGRIFYQKQPTSPGGGQSTIQLTYLLLSPTYAFSSIASSARAIILAGGTMSPFTDYVDHLFPALNPQQITTLSCGHVIPDDNLCVWTLASPRPTTAAGATDFEFSFQRRSDKAMIHELGLAMLNVCSAVPDGVVAFFPSYGYLDEVVQVWQTSNPSSEGASGSIWDRLGARKAVFRETKGGSSEETLAAYSEAILGEQSGTRRGALLLSVVGGKMSEGINFSDRLGRCVLVIGLPYPNIASPEWKAKIEYIESTTVAKLTAGSSGDGSSSLGRHQPGAMSASEAQAVGKQAARDFYENACMRAVNQSIGRAIRHRGDYAAIVLVDRRYATTRIRAKLPAWIRGAVVPGAEEKGMGGLMGTLGQFFRAKAAPCLRDRLWPIELS